MRRFRFIGWLLFLLLFMVDGVSAQAFPFRAVKKGGAIPDVTLTDLSGHPFSFSTLDKGVGVFLFFGADSKIKKRHSVKALRETWESLKPYRDRVTFVAIDAQGDSSDAIKAVTEAAGYDGTILQDMEKRAYKAFGIFVMPSVLIVKNGKIVTGFGYTHNFADLVKAEAEVALGIKTRQEVEEALHPRTKEMGSQEKEALRYYNLGKSMLKKGMTSQAEEAFKKALAIQASYAPAILGMAEIALSRGDISGARASLKKVEAIAPDALETVLVSAKVLAAEKKVDEALERVLPLSLTHPGSGEVNAVLAQLYEQKGDFKKALKYYKKALSLCQNGE